MPLFGSKVRMPCPIFVIDIGVIKLSKKALVF